MKLVKTLLAAVALAGTTTASFAYEGGWYYDNNPRGSEVLVLGDNTDDTYRGFSGTELYCAQPGASYATMRRVIGREYDQITWWIDADCGSVVRVCVENSYGEWACSSYFDEGWGW